LIRELQHRSNNLLSVVQAIANGSLAGDHALPQARKAFEARLQALARANRQLTNSNWGGIRLDEIVRLELEPYAGRTTIDGVDVTLRHQDAQNLSLALHELATNAAKYGALSTKNGRVSVSWSVDNDGMNNALKFKWQRDRGPRGRGADPERVRHLAAQSGLSRYSA
jgi:two-component sensor histidine kinase